MRLKDSTTGGLLTRGWRRGRTACSASTVVQWVRSGTDDAAAVAGKSRLAATARWTERALRASWLYRWLTTDPDPDVVVIDLRETRTVGPILAVLAHVLDPLDRHWDRGVIGRTATHLTDPVAARPVSAVSTAVLAALLTNLLVLVGFGSPSSGAVGARLLMLSLALAGTRVRASAGELRESHAYELAVALLAPPEPPDGSEQDDRRE
jgi:hypothetical protein